MNVENNMPCHYFMEHITFLILMSATTVYWELRHLSAEDSPPTNLNGLFWHDPVLIWLRFHAPSAEALSIITVVLQNLIKLIDVTLIAVVF